MVSRDVATLFMEHMPDDEVRSLRDSIAKAEAELTAPGWERHRELHGRIEELKGKCEEAAHSLTIVLDFIAMLLQAAGESNLFGRCSKQNPRAGGGSSVWSQF
jgi:hypothetical protein